MCLHLIKKKLNYQKIHAVANKDANFNYKHYRTIMVLYISESPKQKILNKLSSFK